MTIKSCAMKSLHTNRATPRPSLSALARKYRLCRVRLGDSVSLFLPNDLEPGSSHEN